MNTTYLLRNEFLGLIPINTPFSQIYVATEKFEFEYFATKVSL